MRCILWLLAFLLFACGDEMAWDHQVHRPMYSKALENSGILAVVNDPTMTFERLDKEVRLDQRAAWRIALFRDGPDRIVGTADDRQFESIDELVELSYVGAVALALLLDYAHSRGYVDVPAGLRPAAVLSVVNDSRVNQWQLDIDAGLDRRAAAEIYAFRAGPDGILGTADDGYFKSLEHLQEVKFVGHRAIARLFFYAYEQGYWQAAAEAFRLH